MVDSKRERRGMGRRCPVWNSPDGHRMSGYLEGAPDLADFVQELSRHGVAYMIVGGHAVGFHSRPRATKDLDVWIQPTDANRRRVVEALASYGAPEEIGNRVLEAKPNEIVWFGRPPNRVDLLQELPGVDFQEAETRTVQVESGEVKVPIIGIEDLIRNKERVGRDQDRVDAKVLRQQLAATKHT